MTRSTCVSFSSCFHGSKGKSFKSNLGRWFKRNFYSRYLLKSKSKPSFNKYKLHLKESSCFILFSLKCNIFHVRQKKLKVSRSQLIHKSLESFYSNKPYQTCSSRLSVAEQPPFLPQRKQTACLAAWQDKGLKGEDTRRSSGLTWGETRASGRGAHAAPWRPSPTSGIVPSIPTTSVEDRVEHV